jgi:hypothetical protein
MRLELIVPGGLIAAAISVGVASWYLSKRAFKKRFAFRPAVTPDEALSEFEAADANALKGLWAKLESVLGVPAGKLRLTDRFQVELRANGKFALYHPEGDVLEDLQECFPNEKLQVSTVRDYCEHALRLKRPVPDATDLAKRVIG